MRELITSDDIFNEIRMTRDVFHGALLVLEGPTDCSIMDSLVDLSACKTLPAHDKSNVLQAVALSDSRGLSGIMGIVDADFDRLRNVQYQSRNICATDLHDMELTMLVSGVMDRMVRQYCDPQKHSLFVKSARQSCLIDAMLEQARPLGLLRLASEKEGLRLNFDALNFSLFVNRDTLRVNISDLITAVISNTRRCVATAASLLHHVQKSMAHGYDLRQLCSGHDVTEFLAIAFRSAVGTCAPAVADPRNIEKMCRMAFAMSDFKKTQMFVFLCDWEKRNTPYRLFAN